MTHSRLRALSSVLISLTLLSGTVFSAPTRLLKPAPSLDREAIGLIKLLEEYHYNRDGVKVSDYAQIIPDFMSEFDGQRLFFLESDREQFARQFTADWLYNNLSSLGKVSPAYDIFSVYETRTTARIKWVLTELTKDFDLNTQEQFAVDRSKANWPATEAEADVLWHKLLTHELIQEILNQKPEKTSVAATTPNDSATVATAPAAPAPAVAATVASTPKSPLDQAREKIRKRYERRLKNLGDIEDKDISEIFLSTVTRLYDPHSTYFSADTFEDFGIQMKLQLVGIGALLGLEEDYCVVKELISGGPAELGKQIRPNDKIIAVAQDTDEPVEVIGMKLRKIVDMIRGKKGTKVRLIIQPATDATQRKEYTLVRDVVKLESSRARASIYDLPSANGKTIPVGVIVLPAFYGAEGENGERTSATRDVADLIAQLKPQGIQGLVLDLRQNGGGLLNEAIDLAGLFIKQGPVVQVKNFYGEIKVDRDENPDIDYNGPMAVLVSKFSASASEIVAGALQNYGRAIIIGDSSTHGKGSVQNLIEMKNAAPPMTFLGAKVGAVKLTIQKFYLPDGHSTQLKGVVPDIILPSIDDYLPVGEKDLPRALVWDEIPTSNFDGQPLSVATLAPLQEASRQRQASLEEFAYLRKNIDWFKVRQEQKTAILNIDERRAQRESDTAFRKTMKAEKAALSSGEFTSRDFTLGPPKKANIKPDKTDDDDELAETEEEAKKLDVHLRESLRVIQDAIVAGQHIAVSANDSAAPLTAQAVRHN